MSSACAFVALCEYSGRPWAHWEGPINRSGLLGVFQPEHDLELYDRHHHSRKDELADDEWVFSWRPDQAVELPFCICIRPDGEPYPRRCAYAVAFVCEVAR